MTKDEVIDLVKQVIGDYSRDQYWPFFTEDLVQFANLVESRTASYSAALLQSQAATLATVTPLVQQMLSALEDAFDDSNHVLAEYKQLYTERYRPQRLHAQEDVVKNCDLAITAARAFLSGATKESTDHGRQTDR